MPLALDDDRRKSAVELAQAAAGLSHAQRLAFVQSRSSDPDVVQEALALADGLARPQETPRRIGSQIGHFVLTERLGSGGMGEVFAARDLELERVVAIKFLNPEWSGLPGAEEKLVREAKTASALNHPNIVTIHEVIRSDSSLAIVMERVEGISLRLLCGQPLPITRILSIGEQIGHALAAAHAAGIVHRDIKPENVMLRPDGRVKVLDFGLAKWSGQDGHTNQSMNSVVPGGTWRYMSPEHYKSAPLTSASDVFALGLVLFELSTGGHPFPADSPLEALHAIANEDAPQPSTRNALIPPQLDSLILGMLAKDPVRRPAAAAVAAALKDAELVRSVTAPGSPVRPGIRNGY